jgi:hypothetical protein
MGTFGEESVSPELVLVDPELARRLRPIASKGGWSPSVSAAVFIPAPVAAPRQAATETVPSRNASRLAPPRALRGVVIAVVAASSGFAAGALFHEEEGGTQGRVHALAPEGGRLEPPLSRPVAATAKSARRRLAGRTRVPAKARTATRKPSVSKAAVHSATSRSRGVSWQQTRFATFYSIVFTRGGTQALETWTRRTELPATALRLRAGKYRWTIRPGYGNPRLRKVPGRTFYGPVVSRGVLVVPRGQ